jgi:hypothetical protein
MTTTAAASFAPSFAPQTSTVGVTDPDLAPAVVAAVREWRREDKLKTAIDAATKAAAALEAGELVPINQETAAMILEAVSR